ncbi:hypothetical protein RHMOL_Rhmol11G0026100 [Rhododendron molle]|uniref:Uncharacterized protein n=1 Tax=Rhododendron molle TaxID=49168 RepID=A0ACC0LMW7_RHOML|nr:hypothetical protein RHMOL_Rhmol11G0026100 [Rhododendron molle]
MRDLGSRFVLCFFGHRRSLSSSSFKSPSISLSLSLVRTLKLLLEAVEKKRIRSACGEGADPPVEAVRDTGAVEGGGGNGDLGREQEVGDELVRHKLEGEERMTEEAGTVGPSVEPVGSSTVAGDSPIIGGSSGSAGGSGAEGDDIGPNGSPPRDPMRGKGAVTEEEGIVEACFFVYRKEDVLFRPGATSLGHGPITKHDVTEYLSDEPLAKLLEENPTIGIAVLEAKEERARAIAASEAAERAEREREREL